jgi:protein-serine/threonine kinase
MEDKKAQGYLDIRSNDTPVLTNEYYPTTPSTFPQPVLQHTPPVGYPTKQVNTTAFSPPEYFTSNHHASQYGAHPCPTTASTADPSSALAYHFSNQNLGVDSGTYPISFRGRPTALRSNGAARHTVVENHPSAAIPRAATTLPMFAQIPDRNPDQYGLNANRNQKKCSQQASDFFKDSVKRVRERNQRYRRLASNVSRF